MKLFSLCLLVLLLATAFCADSKENKDEKFEFALNLKGGLGAATGLEDIIEGFKQSVFIKDLIANMDFEVVKETMEHIMSFLTKAKDEVEGLGGLKVPQFDDIKGKLVKKLSPF